MSFIKEILKGIWSLLYSIFGDSLVAILLTLFAMAAIIALSPYILRFIYSKRYTKEQWKALNGLLAHGAVVELFAPAKSYTRPLAEGEKPPAKLSYFKIFKRAIKASHKRNRVGKNFAFEADRQIKEAAKHIHITPLTEDEAAVMNDDSYRLKLDLMGNAKEDVAKLIPRIQSQIGAFSITPIEDEFETQSITFLVHPNKPKDMLAARKIGQEFFNEHRPQNPKRLPIAKTADGNVWEMPIHHTLICGETGSGKGSAFLSIVRQASNFVKQGTCKLYGIDPKHAELNPFTQTSLFAKIGMQHYSDMAEIIEEVYNTMELRKAHNLPNLSKGVSGRSLSISTENPLILLMVDELPELLKLINNNRDKVTLGKLNAILTQGRSMQIYFIGATQIAEKEVLGVIRQSAGNRIILRSGGSAYLNDFMLGQGAKEAGYDSTQIPLATEANGYATAGIGYVATETNEIKKIRFPFMSDQELTQWLYDEWSNPAGTPNNNASLFEEPAQQEEYEWHFEEAQTR